MDPSWRYRIEARSDDGDRRTILVDSGDWDRLKALTVDRCLHEIPGVRYVSVDPGSR